jgi:hypothetical protein
MAASRHSWFRVTNLRCSSSSLTKAFTTRMPLSDSFKCMWSRAIFWLTLWNMFPSGRQTRTFTNATAGIGARIASASIQFVANRKPTTPISISALTKKNGSPSTKKNQSRSVSFVTRLAIAPTGRLSKNLRLNISTAR